MSSCDGMFILLGGLGIMRACGKLFVGESTFVVEGILERKVLRTFLSLM